MSVATMVGATAALFALGTLFALALLRGGRCEALPHLTGGRIEPVGVDATVGAVPRRPRERDERT